VSGWPGLEAAVERELAGPTGPLRRAVRRLGRTFPPGVYIFGYHSVVDRVEHEQWELDYHRVATWLDDFEAQLELLCRSMTPIALAEAEAELAGGAPERAVFTVTFDDAYANIARGAADACERLGLRPTVFASADFVAGRAIYHRVLLSVLAARELVSEELLVEAKDSYVAGETEAAAAEAWRTLAPDEAPPRAHLSFDDLRALVARGWTVGNHGRSHATLVGLDEAGLDLELLENQAELEREGLEPLPWIAYPNGAAQHVGPHVREWLAQHPGLRGLFGAGGVNLVPTTDEWLRIPVGDGTAAQLGRWIRANVEATRRSLP
jgi:peptidoglycan/xylan/chitin deacetylase (PgdA/CDA1 family)